METNNIQTRKDEIRFFTNKPEEMLGKYLAKRLLRTWQEDLSIMTPGKLFLSIVMK